MRDNLPLYTIVDWDGDPITGTFYQQELEKVLVDPDKTFQIEKVLKTRKRKGHKKEYFVKWLYYPKKFNSWVTNIGDYHT